MQQGIDIAVKQMECITSRQDHADLIREAYIMSICIHPNIAVVYGVTARGDRGSGGGGESGRSEGPVGGSIVMRYYERGSLDDVLEESRRGLVHLTERQRVQLLADVARGMNYLHHGMIGRKVRGHDGPQGEGS